MNLIGVGSFFPKPLDQTQKECGIIFDNLKARVFGHLVEFRVDPSDDIRGLERTGPGRKAKDWFDGELSWLQ